MAAISQQRKSIVQSALAGCAVFGIEERSMVEYRDDLILCIARTGRRRPFDIMSNKGAIMHPVLVTIQIDWRKKTIISQFRIKSTPGKKKMKNILQLCAGKWVIFTQLELWDEQGTLIDPFPFQVVF